MERAKPWRLWRLPIWKQAMVLFGWGLAAAAAVVGSILMAWIVYGMQRGLI